MENDPPSMFSKPFSGVFQATFVKRGVSKYIKCVIGREIGQLILGAQNIPIKASDMKRL